MIVNDPSKARKQTIILAVVLAILQLAIVPNFGIGSGRANLTLVFVVVACLGGNAAHAPIIGFCAGLFYDLAGTGPIGAMALLLTVLGWVLSLSGQTRVADDLGASFGIFVPCVCVVDIIYAVILLACGLSGSLIETLFLRALPGAILDCIAFAIIGYVMSRSEGTSSMYGSGRHGKRSSGFSMKRGR